MAIWDLLFGGKKTEPLSSYLPNSDTAMFVFDYDSFEGSYGYEIAKAMQMALSGSSGACAFSDGDLEVAAGGVSRVSGFLANLGRTGWHVESSHEGSPLSQLDTYNEPIYGFVSAMWTDNSNCTQMIHESLIGTLNDAYLGVLVRNTPSGSQPAFFDVIRQFELVPTTTFRRGKVVRKLNPYGL